MIAADSKAGKLFPQQSRRARIRFDIKDPCLVNSPISDSWTSLLHVRRYGYVLNAFRAEIADQSITKQHLDTHIYLGDRQI
jgi:hypothetical protein